MFSSCHTLKLLKKRNFPNSGGLFPISTHYSINPYNLLAVVADYSMGGSLLFIRLMET